MPGDQASSFPTLDAKARGFLFVALVALGAYLRLWHLGSQIPFDDEWHGIAYVLDQDFGSLFLPDTRLGANSVAYNLYLWLAARTVGLSEATLALPSLLSGILLLWCYPRWVGRRFGSGAALVSVAVLALAPFLIFYSRFARPYAILLLFEAWALTHLADWLASGQARHRNAAFASGVIACWLHATAWPALLAAWSTAWLLAARRRGPSGSVAPGPKQVAKTGALLLALASALTVYWYALEVARICSGVAAGVVGLLRGSGGGGPASLPAAPAAAYSHRTFIELFAVLSGSGSVPLRLLVAGLAGAGWVLAARRLPGPIALLSAAALGALGAVLGLHPLNSESGAVLARYALPWFLLGPLAVGVCGQALLERVRPPRSRLALSLATPLALLAALYFSGPLPEALRSPCSFTKHPALLLDIDKHPPDQARPDPYVLGATAGLARAELQPFYAQLARQPGSAPVIEYPFLLGRKYNLLYFPQELHRRPVLAGYYASEAQDGDEFGLAMTAPSPAAKARSRGGNVTGAMMIDHVLGRGGHDRRVAFRTVVNILDEPAVARSGAEYLVLHGNLLREFFNTGPVRVRSYFVGRILAELAGRYGAPIYEDELLTVFRLSGPR